MGVEPGAVAGGVGVGTLLGPEGSGPSHVELAGVPWVCGVVVSLRASLGAGTRVRVWVVLGGFVV